MHIILWEFTVPGHNRDAFERAYGPSGAWAVLFGKANGYKGTELLRGETYVTIDRWQTESHFEQFRQQFAGEYAALDKALEGLSSEERRIGGFKSCL